MGSEVLIIGGGVIGLSIARELRKKGVRDIVIVDRGKPGREASWAAAGMLAPNIEANVTPEFHRFGVEALELYPRVAEELKDETGIDIELDRTGTLCVAFDETEAVTLDHTLIRQKQRGVPVEWLDAAAIGTSDHAISSKAVAGLYYPRDCQVDNRKLVTALRRYLELRRIQVIENTEIANLLTEGSAIVGASTAAGKLYADRTVVATGAWTSLIKIDNAEMPFDVSPMRGQMLSFTADSRLLQHVVYSLRGYLVPRADGRILVGATVEDVGFDKSVTDEGVAELRTAAVEILPELGRMEITERWAGLRPFTRDSLPVIGEVPGFQNSYVATGHYRNGILLAPLTAKIISDEIVDEPETSWLRAFGAERFITPKANVSSV